MAFLDNPISDRASPPARLISAAIRAPGLTVAAFLAHGRGTERFLWQSGGRTLAGIGVASELTAWGPDRFQQIEQQAAHLFDGRLALEGDPLAEPCLFGGFSFLADFVPDNTWSIYAPAMFVLPHYQFTQQANDDPWLILNVTVAADEAPDAIQAELLQALQAQLLLLLTPVVAVPHNRSAPTEINYPMPNPIWTKAIAQATAAIQAGDLIKVVLARAFELRFGERVDVEAALQFLSEKYANCYRFLFEPRPYHAFYGATPEQLIQVSGRQFSTMALAGSIRRGQNPADDQVLADALWHNPKERSEHQIVVERLRAKLAPLACTLDIPTAPDILKLSNIQHLHTPIRGELCEPSGILPLVEQLHPTPALGGEPSEAAIRLINTVEPVPRGWYAAPIGVIDARLDGEFGVAIRSAVSEERRVWLYAGAGIVADSQAQQEWDETTLKFRPMLNALGLSDLSAANGAVS